MEKAMDYRILIVDDNPDDIEITKIAFARFNRKVKVEAASHAEDALEHLRDGKKFPSLILLDLKMPGMNGLDMLRKMRSDKRMKHIPVIIVTSSSLERDEKAAYELGANGFLHKAFDIGQFTRNLEILMDRYLVG